MKLTPESIISLLTQYSENPTYGVTERDALKEAAELISELANDKERLDWMIPEFMTRSTALLNKFDIYIAHGMSERQAIDAAMEQEQ